MTDPVLVEREGAVVRLTLNRPAAGNAIDLDLARALVAAAERCANDDAIRCVVLTGTGRMFCAGGDVALFASAGDAASDLLRELAGTLHRAIKRLATMTTPLLVLVNGPAAGAGLSLAALGDIVLAARSAHFTAAYTAIGLTPDGGLSWLLPRLVGLRQAQEMILTNTRLDAAAAVARGLVTRVIDDEALAAEGAAAAAKLAAAPTRALGAVRALLLEGATATLATQLDRELEAISTAGGQADGREGFAAFLARRKPDFSGA